MKTPARPLLAAFFLTASAYGEITLTGFVGVAKKPFFNLTDSATNTNEWVGVGQSFQGFTLASYDVSRKVLTLKRQDETLDLRLRSASNLDQSPPVNPTSGVTELAGLELALELAQNGDEQISDLLGRYFAALSPGDDPKPPAEVTAVATGFLKSRIIALAQQKSANAVAGP